MKTSSAKAKGRNAAKLVRKMLLEHTDLKPEDILCTPGGVPGEDIKFSPYARAIYPISIEVKCQEQLNIFKAIEQCESNANSYTPVVFFKKNRTTMYAAMPAQTFVDLIQLLFNHFEKTSNEQ